MPYTVSTTVSDETLSRIIQIESSGDPEAKNPNSTATGLGQFLQATWLEELEQHRPDLFKGPPYDDELALRTNPTLAIEILARFTEDNAEALGPGYTDGDLYLAHFLGLSAAKRLLAARGDDPVAEHLSPSAINANPGILKGRTVGQVRAWAEQKMAAAGGHDWIATHYRPNSPTPPIPGHASEPPWVTHAEGFVGLKEIVGSRHEPKIVSFFAEAGHPNVRDDETAWCAAFANAMLKRAGIEGTGLLTARSFLNWGEALAKPRPGCIVVFKRGTSAWQGHVAFYVSETATHIRVLGGNQGNAVSIANYPKADLLGYRWPAGYVLAPAASKPAPAPAPKDGAVAGIGAILLAALAAAWAFVKAHLPEILIGAVVLTALAILAFRLAKGRYPWTGDQSQAPSPPSPPSSAPSLAQLSEARLALQSVASQETPSPQPSASKPRRKRSAKPSPATRKPSANSKSSKLRKASASGRKRKSASKS